jgi:hypothetical protein
MGETEKDFYMIRMVYEAAGPEILPLRVRMTEE